MKKKMSPSEAWRYYLREFMEDRGHQMDDFAVMDLQTIVMAVAAGVIALIVVVMILGNLDTAVMGELVWENTSVNATDAITNETYYVGVVDNTSAYYPLLNVVNNYGVVGITLLAIGIIVAGAAAILYIIRGSF